MAWLVFWRTDANKNSLQMLLNLPYIFIDIFCQVFSHASLTLYYNDSCVQNNNSVFVKVSQAQNPYNSFLFPYMHMHWEQYTSKHEEKTSLITLDHPHWLSLCHLDYSSIHSHGSFLFSSRSFGCHFKAFELILAEQPKITLIFWTTSGETPPYSNYFTQRNTL